MVERCYNLLVIEAGMGAQWNWLIYRDHDY